MEEKILGKVDSWLGPALKFGAKLYGPVLATST